MLFLTKRLSPLLILPNIPCESSISRKMYSDSALDMLLIAVNVAHLWALWVSAGKQGVLSPLSGNRRNCQSIHSILSSPLCFVIAGPVWVAREPFTCVSVLTELEWGKVVTWQPVLPLTTSACSWMKRQMRLDGTPSNSSLQKMVGAASYNLFSHHNVLWKAILLNIPFWLFNFFPVKLPPPKFTVTAEGDKLNVNWTHPGIGSNMCWNYTVCYRKCDDPNEVSFRLRSVQLLAEEVERHCVCQLVPSVVLPQMSVLIFRPLHLY